MIIRQARLFSITRLMLTGAVSLFLATAAAHIALAAYTLLRISKRAPVPVDAREAFKTMPSERGATPEAARLDPRIKPEQDG